MGWRGAALNGLVVVVSIGVFLAVTEGVVRILQARGRTYPLVYYETEDPAVTLWCYDEKLSSIPDYDLRKGSPYHRITWHGSEGLGPGLQDLPYTRVPLALEVRNNADGFRERPFEELATERNLTLVVGDSFCFGQGVRARDRLSDRLEGLWRARSPDASARVANLCRASADIEEIADILASGLDRLPNASRVLYVYNLNDVIRSPSLQERQKYINDLMHLREYNVGQLLPFLLRPAGRSAAVRWAMYRISRPRITLDTEDWYRRLYADNPGWPETQRRIVEMDRLCRSRGMELIVAVFPILHRLDDYPFTGIHAALTGFCAGHGIRCIDLLPAFRGLDARTLWVHPTDFHPNHLAHARVAEFLAQAIGADMTRTPPGPSDAKTP